MSSTKIDLKIACMRAFSLFSFVLVFQQPVWSQSNTSISLRGLPATLNGAEVVANSQKIGHWNQKDRPGVEKLRITIP